MPRRAAHREQQSQEQGEQEEQHIRNSMARNKCCTSKKHYQKRGASGKACEEQCEEHQEQHAKEQVRYIRKSLRGTR